MGRGGMGVVYEADRDGARVALKTVIGLHGYHVDAVRREIHALARLKHPGVVSVVDEGTHDGVPWYAMQLIEGVPLNTYVRNTQGDALLDASLAESLRAGVTDLDPFSEPDDQTMILPSHTSLNARAS